MVRPSISMGRMSLPFLRSLFISRRAFARRAATGTYFLHCIVLRPSLPGSHRGSPPNSGSSEKSVRFQRPRCAGAASKSRCEQDPRSIRSCLSPLLRCSSSGWGYRAARCCRLPVGAKHSRRWPTPPEIAERRHSPYPDSAHWGGTHTLRLASHPPRRILLAIPLAAVPSLWAPKDITMTAKNVALGPITDLIPATAVLRRKPGSVGCFTYFFGESASQ